MEYVIVCLIIIMYYKIGKIGTQIIHIVPNFKC